MNRRSCEVTVIIPTRNRVAFLARALGCALGQADVRCEIRVVDDASSDGTAELLRRCSDSRVKWSRSEVPLGVAAARNIAASEAQGEWLAFLDDDDLWAPTWLRTALRIGRAQEAGLVYGSRWIVDDHCRVVGSLLAEHPRQLRRTLADHNSLGGPSAVMVRIDVMAAAGGFDPRLSALADWDAWLRILDIGHGVPVSEPLTAYTVHPDNMHLRDPFGMLAEFALFAEIVKARGERLTRSGITK